jgi:hypothetical protein
LELSVHLRTKAFTPERVVVRLLGADGGVLGAIPVPERATERVGFTGSLLAMESAAVRVPMSVGRKETLIAHFAPGTKVAPQALVLRKSPAFVPANETLVIVNDARPVFDNVTVCPELVVETA